MRRSGRTRSGIQGCAEYATIGRQGRSARAGGRQRRHRFAERATTCRRTGASRDGGRDAPGRRGSPRDRAFSRPARTARRHWWQKQAPVLEHCSSTTASTAKFIGVRTARKPSVVVRACPAARRFAARERDEVQAQGARWPTIRSARRAGPHAAAGAPPRETRTKKNKRRSATRGKQESREQRAQMRRKIEDAYATVERYPRPARHRTDGSDMWCAWRETVLDVVMHARRQPARAAQWQGLNANAAQEMVEHKLLNNTPATKALTALIPFRQDRTSSSQALHALGIKLLSPAAPPVLAAPFARDRGGEKPVSEMLDGRVKTLHEDPRGGWRGATCRPRRGDRQHGIDTIDCGGNLTRSKRPWPAGCTRSALETSTSAARRGAQCAKNWKDVGVLTDASQYPVALPNCSRAASSADKTKLRSRSGFNRISSTTARQRLLWACRTTAAAVWARPMALRQLRICVRREPHRSGVLPRPSGPRFAGPQATARQGTPYNKLPTPMRVGVRQGFDVPA